MQYRHDDFGRGTSLSLVNVDRYAAPVILHRYRSVAMNHDPDLTAVPGQGFVDRVIYGFKYHMMQTGAVIGITDIHPRPFAYSIETF